jgi:hypothetical protein
MPEFSNTKKLPSYMSITSRVNIPKRKKRGINE